MSAFIRIEEYAALGDFVKTSLVKYQAEIEVRFPKLNAAFLTSYNALLEEVKTLESALVQTEEQKNATTALYAEADILNKELSFLTTYMIEAGLNRDAVSALKKDLTRGNIEGALLKIEGVKQYIAANSAALEEEGMNATFSTQLEAHKTSMGAKNALQNAYINSRKELTSANKAKYKELYRQIVKIMNAGKLVFANSVTRDEFSIAKTVARMRAGGK